MFSESIRNSSLQDHGICHYKGGWMVEDKNEIYLKKAKKIKKRFDSVEKLRPKQCNRKIYWGKKTMEYIRI